MIAPMQRKYKSSTPSFAKQLYFERERESYAAG
jgi:hypothetical protein